MAKKKLRRIAANYIFCETHCSYTRSEILLKVVAKDGSESLEILMPWANLYGLVYGLNSGLEQHQGWLKEVKALFNPAV